MKVGRAPEGGGGDGELRRAGGTTLGAALAEEGPAGGESDSESESESESEEDEEEELEESSDEDCTGKGKIGAF